MSDTSKRVACPNCKSDESLGTIEYLSAISHCVVTVDDEGVTNVHHTGTTDFMDDEMHTVGFICRECAWSEVNTQIKAADKVVRDSKPPVVEWGDADAD